MISDESRNKYMTLLIGIAIGAMLGFVFGMFMSGSAAPDPYYGLARIEPFYTTVIGCIIAFGFALLYVYIAEWSKLDKSKKEQPREAGVE